MTESIIIGIVTVVVLGIGSQWLAWQIRVPSILLLLVVGFLAGPVLRLLPPDTLHGDWVLAFVSLSIGIILFEGGLNLRRSELREVGAPVLRLITVGVLATWVLAGLAAYYILGFSAAMSAQIGAILTVTGPTVVIPLLRHVRPQGRVGAIAKWEGITIDPVGAILAVLVLETLLLVHQSVSAGGEYGVLELVGHAVEGLFLILLVSVAISIASATLLILLLYRRLVPDYLQSSVALMMVVGSFGLSNLLQAESGLLQVTIFGIIMANQRWVTLRKITEFKENLQVLLIACLFIVLSARLELDALGYIDLNAIIYLLVIIALIRPASVFLATAGTRLNVAEKGFLSWLAPRGIVAAAVASLFAYKLRDVYPDEAVRLVPIVFLIIVGTVAVYGMSLSPVARWLRLADPDPQGTVILGAHAWGR
ncbi:MAG TPA: sodium:proton antiporter, partial [Rhodothermales bacterium]|nr:sodium:proton antiporter [Rhodothermales bacterium]